MTTEAATRRMHGAPCWVSLLVHSLSATQDFYGALFGWEFRPGPQHFGPYVRAVLDGREVAGVGELAPTVIFRSPGPPIWPATTPTRRAEQIRSCGGTVGVGPLDADDDAGRMAIASDPTGRDLRHLAGRSADRAPTITGEPGTPAWNELVTRDTSSVLPFYEHVFGSPRRSPWSPAELRPSDAASQGPPGGRYPRRGQPPATRPGPHWMTHFAVTDTDAAVRRVTQLGGQVLQAAWDSAHGRLATVADSEGAAFTIIQRS